MNKSDFEINKAVAEKLDVRVYERSAGMLFTATEHRGEYNFTKFDPCNNPADAMPIIIKNGITVMYDSIGNTWCAHAGSVMDDCGWDYKITPAHYADSDNYYRAAMEVFLMMEDAEK